ncbi:MAG TPA: hypothetical protein VF733_06070 [Candidatus Saccharimonadales bacterium]
MKRFDLTGEWISRYVYLNSASESNASEHVVILHQNDNKVVGRSLPQSDGSMVELHLTYDSEGGTLTGTWREQTSSKGRYRGTLFHGALQLLLNKAHTKAAGKWVGFNSSRTEVKSGEWQIARSRSKSAI